jgi:hypothetical protein
VAPEPEEPAMHEKEYEVAPRTGAAGTMAMFGYPVSGGCESVSTSAAESARL